MPGEPGSGPATSVILIALSNRFRGAVTHHLVPVVGGRLEDGVSARILHFSEGLDDRKAESRLVTSIGSSQGRYSDCISDLTQ
jgi:hypothetical protein